MEKVPNCPYCGKAMERGFLIYPGVGIAAFDETLHMGWYSGDVRKRNVSYTDPEYDVLNEPTKLG